jgi:hypothetical protein
MGISEIYQKNDDCSLDVHIQPDPKKCCPPKIGE